MKRFIISFCLMIGCVALYAQTKMPTIMVFPSDAYCVNHGYAMTYKGQTLPDYDKFVKEDQELSKGAINALKEELTRRAFSFCDFKMAVKLLSEGGKTAVPGKPLFAEIIADSEINIAIMVDADVRSIGPRKNVMVNIQAVNVEDKKMIAMTTHTLSMTTAPLDQAFKECVAAEADEFFNQLISYFIDTKK